MQDINEALETALSMEKKGYDIYMEAAKKTVNKLGKFTLEAIAAKELDHIEAIKNYGKSINKAIEIINPKDKNDYIRPIMERLKKELDLTVKADSDLENAYKVALGLEKTSYDFYKKQAAETEDPLTRKFFEFLMGEENTHYELLSETLEYLNKTGDWYREQERWIIEG